MFNITDLFTSGISKVVDSAGSALDKLVTSDEEREIIKKELQQIKLDAILETENNYLKHEAEITKRWQSDNEHFITRLVRPLGVVWVLALFTIVVMFDGNVGEFSINKAYIPIIETILVTIIIAYYGSRGFEKTFNPKKKEGLS